jgi:hypothetical protein
LSAGPDPALEDEHQRWLIAYQRSELTALKFQVEEQQRRLRRRTAWLVAVVAFGGLMSTVVVGQALYGDLLERIASLMRQLGIL